MSSPLAPDPSALRSRLAAHAPAMLEDLERLVRAESPSADGAALRECRAVLADIGSRRLGREPTVLPDDATSPRPGGLVWRLGPAERRPVLLVGHFDTVWPRGTLERRPFRVDGSRATGPGVFDMKAGLVQGLHALAQLTARSVEHEPAVALLVTADEEVGSPAGGPAVSEWASAARAALVLEGAAEGGALKHARKGWSFYDIHVTGRAAHAGLEPAKGQNALVDLARLVVRLESLAAQDERITVTPTVASAGTTQNTVPDTAHVTVDVRVPDLAAQREIDTALRRLVAETAQLPCEIRGGANRPPLAEADARALVGAARECAEELQLEWPGSVAVGGISDGNLCAAAGAPTLDGLGAVGGGPHAEHEWTDVAQMPERAALVARLVTRLAEPA